MKQKLHDICRKLNIEFYGIALPGPYPELENFLKKRVSEGKTTGMEEKELRRRVDPQLTMPNVKSIIVCLFPYFTAADTSVNCNISVHARGADYHKIVKGKLELLGELLGEPIRESRGGLPGEEFEYKAFSDTGPLVDRYLAYLAGLGFYGLNNCLYNEKYGSFFFIGYLLNNYPFEPDKPAENLFTKCRECRACINACPGAALGDDYNYDPRNCLSFLTQKKGELTHEEQELLKKHNMIYGCDVCQSVCPLNKNIPETPFEEFKENLVYRLDNCDLEGLSSGGFKKKFAGRTFSWRGKDTLIRNLKHINHK